MQAPSPKRGAGLIRERGRKNRAVCQVKLALSSSRRLKFQKRRQLFIGMQRTAFRRRDVRQ